MTQAEANALANRIAIKSADNHLGLNPQIKMIGNDIWVVVLHGKGDYHIFTWTEWQRDFESKLEPEQDTGQVA
jgi:hypothetical protein